MLRFIDGPAAGRTLMCARAPVFLRVVESEGKFDALDQLQDTPEPFERIHVYVKASDDGTIHLDYTDRNSGRRRGRWERCASYRHHTPQPDDATARATASWRTWCEEQFTALTPEDPAP